MQRVTVRLDISPERFQAYYQGVVEHVVATASDGRTVRFPARVLRPFFSYQGVQGTFEITCDSNMKFQSIRRTDLPPSQ
jgi:hypothetical protein